MNNYKKLNNILGWSIFAIASMVYILSTEPTASFWDCGEYIATAFKLQVGHPPGAPLFQMLGRFFSIMAFGDVSKVAHMINIMSALSSSFTILFLFWTLTILARKIVVPQGIKPTKANLYTIFGAAITGSLAYTFSDSFWFSAVEGEVYAMSSFFTALVFWAMLKWEEQSEDPHAIRWIILIAYLVGLSIGVHLLNLLTIPAITFIYYFKKYKPTLRGFIITGLISLVILGSIMGIIIPWAAKLAGDFELFFINSLGMPFNSGTIVYFLLLSGGIVYGLYYTAQKRKQLAHILILCITFILIGYSSFFMLVIRSNANTPINENEPTNALNLLAYLNREQYGSWPIASGQYYNAPVISAEDGNPVYTKDEKKGKYVITDDRKGVILVYDPNFTTIFPRMWSNQMAHHPQQYKKWADVKGVPVKVADGSGETRMRPTFAENLRYFWRYQIKHMYWRYFMWNFSGRQDDTQGMYDRLNGNWITGFDSWDEARLGVPANMPDSMKSRAHNKYYMLPFILGIIGLIYQFRRRKQDGWVTFLLFFMTGLAIVVYLNQSAPQPRERDYAYAASFYAFAIWIGLGTLAIIEWLGKIAKGNTAAIAGTLLCVLLVPGIMAAEGWDDHDRSGRYAALATAKNYLNSCEPNAILFTNGDNDTFPLWYAQEVEGIRTDVRVVNLSLLGTDWYIDQMQRKVYDSEPVPFTLQNIHYRQGTRDVVYIIPQDNIKGAIELKDLYSLMKRKPSALQFQNAMNTVDYFPTNHFKITIDSAAVMQNGVVSPEMADQIVPAIEWKINSSALQKNGLMVLDLIAHNNWKRPIYFAITTGMDSYYGLTDYFQLEGFAYKLVPVKTKGSPGYIGRTNTKAMYQNIMTRFDFTGFNNPKVYNDETVTRMAMNYRNNFSRLIEGLYNEGDNQKVIEVYDFAAKALPNSVVPYNFYSLSIAETLLKAGAKEQGKELFEKLINNFGDQLYFYFNIDGWKAGEVDQFKQQNLAIMSRIQKLAQQYELPELEKKAGDIFENYYTIYVQSFQ